MKLIKVKGITEVGKSKLETICGGNECSYTKGNNTYYCDTYHIVIDLQGVADSLTVHI